MWAMFSQSVRPAMGGEQLIFAFIVVIIGGLGSVTGSLVGALLVGLSYNYVAYLVPKAAIGVTMAIMVLVLLVRPDRALRDGQVSAPAGLTPVQAARAAARRGRWREPTALPAPGRAARVGAPAR